jgi:hypothetical protein
MPIDIFIGKSSVQTNIYVFKVNEKHHKDDLVKFIDFSNDGYTRTNRKKSSSNLQDTDKAKERYDEVVNLVRFGKSKLNIFTEREYYEGSIEPKNGADWNQSSPIDTRPSLDDFKKSISDYFAWEISNLIKRSFISNLISVESSKSSTGKPTLNLIEYNLTEEETKALNQFNNLKWQNFNLELLFGKSTRGRRLKSADRISGSLPFVTAGEADEGVSDFIGNNVIVFSENTTTIDMFGSAKYRNYKYGGDDHIAVVHTDKLPKYASIFVTSAIHKSSYNGQFNYGRNFYAKDADELYISLPAKDNKPDYKIMETIISAIHKLVTKDILLYVQGKKL